MEEGTEADPGKSESWEESREPALRECTPFLRQGKQDESLRDSRDSPSFVRVNRRYEKQRRSSSAKAAVHARVPFSFMAAFHPSMENLLYSRVANRIAYSKA
jgi:hypothetical protein